MMPPNDSPLWPILRVAVIGIVLTVCLHIFYANGFSPEVDFKTILLTLVAAGGGEGLQSLFKRKP